MNTRINPKAYIAPGTGLHSAIGWILLLVIGPIVVLYTLVATFGLALIAWIVLGLLYTVRIKKERARIRGSAVRVDTKQFPDIYNAARNMAESLGMAECPEVYIVEDNQQNAWAIKHGSKKFVVLIDDIVYGAQATGNTKALEFIIGHELAHHALGHTGILRGLVRKYYLPLARLDEFSCDAVANALVGDTKAARDALALLLVGPQLFKQLDLQALDQQASEVVADRYSKKSETRLTHPLLLRRYARVCGLAAT